jgi:hypothetical protein
MPTWKASLMTSMRTLVAKLQVGLVDEMRVRGVQGGKGRLVCWNHIIVKGGCMRGMWFYQRNEYSRSGLWFHAVHLCVVRLIRLHNNSSNNNNNGNSSSRSSNNSSNNNNNSNNSMSSKPIAALLSWLDLGPSSGSPHHHTTSQHTMAR